MHPELAHSAADHAAQKRAQRGPIRVAHLSSDELDTVAARP